MFIPDPDYGIVGTFKSLEIRKELGTITDESAGILLVLNQAIHRDSADNMEWHPVDEDYEERVRYPDGYYMRAGYSDIGGDTNDEYDSAGSINRYGPRFDDNNNSDDEAAGDSSDNDTDTASFEYDPQMDYYEQQRTPTDTEMFLHTLEMLAYAKSKYRDGTPPPPAYIEDTDEEDEYLRSAPNAFQTRKDTNIRLLSAAANVFRRLPADSLLDVVKNPTVIDAIIRSADDRLLGDALDNLQSIRNTRPITIDNLLVAARFASPEGMHALLNFYPGLELSTLLASVESDADRFTRVLTSPRGKMFSWDTDETFGVLSNPWLNEDDRAVAVANIMASPDNGTYATIVIGLVSTNPNERLLTAHHTELLRDMYKDDQMTLRLLSRIEMRHEAVRAT